MKDEIKERIKYFKHYVVDNLSLDAQDDFQEILDCITNLQEELKSANESITWWTNRFNALQEENKELLEKFSNKIEEVSNLIKENEKLKLAKDTKCASEILCECLHNEYKSRNEKAIDKIQYIIDYGFDYDGFNTVESLKGLIDMLVDYARQSKDILQGENDDRRNME